MQLTFPAYLKKKKPPPQYKLKAFVGFLFLVIVFLVGFSYVFYHQHVLQVSRYKKSTYQVLRETFYNYYNPPSQQYNPLRSTVLICHF